MTVTVTTLDVVVFCCCSRNVHISSLRVMRSEVSHDTTGGARGEKLSDSFGQDGNDDGDGGGQAAGQT